jgi:hypothetical protein
MDFIRRGKGAVSAQKRRLDVGSRSFLPDQRLNARAAAIPAKPPPMMTTRFCFLGAASGRANFSLGPVSSNAAVIESPCA